MTHVYNKWFLTYRARRKNIIKACVTMELSRNVKSEHESIGGNT